jgi:hypothetical protein
MKQTAYFLFCLCTLLACQNGQYTKEISNPSPYFTALMEGNDHSVFHGADLNMNQDEVREKEKSKLYERTQDHLFYSLVFPKDSTVFSEYADIQYFFDNKGGVEIISASIYLNDSTQQEHLANTFRQYYNIRYGDAGKDEYGYEVWKGTLEAQEDDYDYTIGLNQMKEEFGIVLEYLRD